MPAEDKKYSVAAIVSVDLLLSDRRAEQAKYNKAVQGSINSIAVPDSN
jgi:hypothetical protein